MISLTVTITLDQYHLIEEYGSIQGLTFSQSLREFINKGYAHELEFQAKQTTIGDNSEGEAGEE